ncbi:MAG: hypothetical protein U9O98_03985 [Asgard group archaeon]|nr:hypothetical protein [Asgard group archaeon]
MNENVLQIASLTAYGNAVLQGKKVRLEKNELIGQKEQQITFIQQLLEPEAREKIILAENITDWFSYLQNKRYQKLYLTYKTADRLKIKDHVGMAFVGGGSTWTILAEKKGQCNVWAEQKQKAQDERKKVYYLLKKGIHIPKIKITPVSQAELYLREIVEDVVLFTKQNGLDKWQRIFEKALTLLSIENEEELLQEGLLPEGCYSLEATQLLAASIQSWVFGGIRSWTDVIRVGDYDLYMRLTANLYDTVCKALVAAINSYP